MSQHGLQPRVKRRDFVEAATRTGGIQAQLMSAAELAIWARVDGLTRDDMQSALWRDRTLVKTWAMRGTLHLLAAHELPLYAAARSISYDRNWLKNFTYYGITPEQYEAFLVAVPQVLSGEPMTRQQVATEAAERIRAPELAEILLSSSWGSLWKPSALRGDLCFGPNQGRNVTFVRPSEWIGSWEPVEPHAAFQEIARRYLRAYGPARPEDFALWWSGGSGLATTRKLFKSLESELEAVDVEGWHALALSETLEPMERLERHISDLVRLLPLFDAYTIGQGRDHDALLQAAYKRQVFRPQGWISAVVLVGGSMKGVWEHKSGASRTTVKVSMFSPPTASVRKGIKAEAERLAAFLNKEVAVEFGGV
ncbi:MAG: winged helix DNA-binding domain-containing protein [Chloroflexia bacterium]